MRTIFNGVTLEVSTLKSAQAVWVRVPFTPQIFKGSVAQRRSIELISRRLGYHNSSLPPILKIANHKADGVRKPDASDILELIHDDFATVGVRLVVRMPGSTLGDIGATPIRSEISLTWTIKESMIHL